MPLALIWPQISQDILAALGHRVNVLSSGGWKSKIKVPALFLAGAWLSSFCVLTWHFLCMHTERGLWCLFPPLLRTPDLSD